jgi:hypothetical protein
METIEENGSTTNIASSEQPSISSASNPNIVQLISSQPNPTAHHVRISAIEALNLDRTCINKHFNLQLLFFSFDCDFDLNFSFLFVCRLKRNLL